MTVIMRTIVLTGVIAALVFGVLPLQPSYAHSGHPEDGESHTEQHDHGKPDKAANKDEKDVIKSADASKRLSEGQQRACERRETAVKSIMARSRERASRQLELFTTIADRTKAFYAEKGNTLADYDELAAAADAAKVKAETSLSVIPDATDFNCSSEDPKASGKAFKLALRQGADDLKAYKTAVKNLIVGVKSVQSTESN